MKIDTKILDSMVWSFSRLNSFHNCKYAWYIQYVLPKMFDKYFPEDIAKILKSKIKGEDNCFGQWGTFGHKILEQFAKKELDLYELSSYYEDNYSDNITYEFPPNKYVDLADSYYQAGLDFFNNFDGFNGYKIIDAEKEIHYKLGEKYDFIGYIDLILQDNKDNIIILDYKSKGDFKNKKELKEYSRQPYLYSQNIFDTYGKYPKEIIFDMFRKGNIVKVPFKKKDFNEAQKWAVDTIKEIYNNDTWEANVSKFFCDYICNFRNNMCEYRKE